MNRIAVLMPVFNEEKFIRQSLVSVVNQSLKPYIVLIGDNESTDKTSSVAEEILRETDIYYEIIRVKRFAELGKLNINNVLYHLTKRLSENSEKIDYIAIVEADVVLERRYFEKLIKIFEKHRKLCIAGGVLKPFGLPQDPFPLIRLNINLWGCNRVYKAYCWFQLNKEYDIRLLPAWDTDHVIIALYKGYHVYQVKNAVSVTLRGINPFRGKAKGYTDAIHGLPIWWALYKAMQYRDLEYLSSYIYTTIFMKKFYEKISFIKRLYNYSAYRVFLRKILKIL
jgi:glycosyltransferase involved in cell wall biosynthesis